MDENARKNLEAVGIDVSDAMSRLMNNDKLYLKVLKQFTEDDSFERLKAGIEAKDAKQTFEGAHALKGVASNLAITRLYQSILPIVETTRAGSMEGVEEQLPRVTACYEEALAAIRTLD